MVLVENLLPCRARFLGLDWLPRCNAACITGSSISMFAEIDFFLAVFVKIVVFNEIQSKSLNGQQFVQMFSNIKDV